MCAEAYLLHGARKSVDFRKSQSARLWARRAIWADLAAIAVDGCDDEIGAPFAVDSAAAAAGWRLGAALSGPTIGRLGGGRAKRQEKRARPGKFEGGQVS